MGTVAALGTALTHFPASDTTMGVHAGMNFEAPRAMRPLLQGPSEWKILSFALRRVADGVGKVQGVADVPARASKLISLSAALASAGAKVTR